MKFKTVSSMHIVSEIKKLRIGKAVGPDNIPITVVRDVGDIAAKPLAMIFNSSFRKRCIPRYLETCKSNSYIEIRSKKGCKQLHSHFGHFSLLQDLGAHSAGSDTQHHS